MEKNGILIIIQARMGATRLPGKVLMNLKGKTVLERVVERAISAEIKNSTLVVATTSAPEDKKIEELCHKEKINIFRGSENDVLDRFYQTALAYPKEHIVRITADCPLIDPDIINLAVNLHLTKKSDYTSNVIKPTYPDGEDVEVFTFSALEKAWREATLNSEREHVTPYIRNHPEMFKLLNFECSHGDLSFMRWTLDEKRDYAFIKKIYSHFASVNRKKIFKMAEILDYLNANPEIADINKGIMRNEGYLKSIELDKIRIADKRTIK